MADVLDLTHKDYRNFVKHCKECNSTLEIYFYINQKLSKYYKDNNDILNCLLEKVDELDISGVEYDLESANPYFSVDVSNFRIDLPKAKNGQLKYLYSYLCHLSESKNEFDMIVGKPKTVIKVNPNKSFNSTLNRIQLEDLFHFLSTKSYLEKKSEDDFYKIFSAYDLNEIRPVKWLPKVPSGSNIRLLFELIKHLCSHEYADVEKINTFYQKVIKCFLDYEGTSFELIQLRISFSKWPKDKFTTKCLSQRGYKNKDYWLLDYLQEHKLLYLGQ